MHHSLNLYGRYQPQFLRLYMALARLTRVPVVGGVVKVAANAYARREHRAYALTLAEAEKLIESTDRLALGPCRCRQLHHGCDAPVMAEILVGEGVDAFLRHGANGFRRINREEARHVLRQCHEKKLVHAVVRCREHYYAICNCCSCCCVPMRLKQQYGIGLALVRGASVVEDYLNR